MIWTTNPDLRSQSEVSLLGNKWGGKPTAKNAVQNPTSGLFF